jgi:quercetin dioxygenase-like cupin family protein
METKLIKSPKLDKHPEYPGVDIASIVSDNLSSDYRCAIVKIQPDGEILPHIHDTLEVAYVIQGEGMLLVNGEYESIKQGETMYAPAGVKHGMKNNTEEEMVLFATFPNCKN